MSHRLQRWARDKTLSFVPPDGRFKLMEYRYAPTSASSIHQIAVPLSMRAHVSIEEHGGTLDLSFTSRLTTRTMESVVVELYLGEGASGASCTASQNASWSFEPRSLVGHLAWKLGLASDHALPAEPALGDEERGPICYVHPARDICVNVRMTGSFALLCSSHPSISAKTPRPARSFRVRFDIMQHSFSALKIDQLKLTGEMYKPYKGMRPRSFGDIEWRW